MTIPDTPKELKPLAWIGQRRVYDSLQFHPIPAKQRKDYTPLCSMVDAQALIAAMERERNEWHDLALSARSYAANLEARITSECCGWPGHGCPCQVEHEATARITSAERERDELQQELNIAKGVFANLQAAANEGAEKWAAAVVERDELRAKVAERDSSVAWRDKELAERLEAINVLSNKVAELEAKVQEMALQALVDDGQQMERTMLTGATVGNGTFSINLEGGACGLLAECFAEQFRESGAVNYLEMTLQSKREPADEFIVTMQRRAGKTPHQLRAEAEAKLATASEDTARLDALQALIGQDVSVREWLDKERAGKSTQDIQATVLQDALRYRHLRAGTPRTTGQPKPGRIEVMQWESKQEANILKGEALDAATDAARASQAQEGK